MTTAAHYITGALFGAAFVWVAAGAPGLFTTL